MFAVRLKLVCGIGALHRQIATIEICEKDLQPGQQKRGRYNRNSLTQQMKKPRCQYLGQWG
jgi:hypothetical protein